MQLRRTATPINASNLAFELTDAEVASLGAGKRPPVVLAVGGTSWEAWSCTRRREAATGITDAKKPDTRARRVATALAALRHP